jgi:hypothetical protein
MFYVGPQSKAGIAIEKDSKGNFYLLLETDGNAKQVEYGISPGTPFGGGTVVDDSGQMMLVLSVMSGERQGLVGTPNVTLLDATSGRTRQRSALSGDIDELAKMGYLRDESGRTYNATDISKIALVFQVPAGMDTTLSFGVADVKAMKNGEIKQLGGETIQP